MVARCRRPVNRFRMDGRPNRPICPVTNCLEFFRFGAGFDEPVEEAAEAGLYRAAWQGPAEHLQDVLGAEEGIDDAVKTGSKVHGWCLWRWSEMARFGLRELKFAL